MVKRGDIGIPFKSSFTDRDRAKQLIDFNGISFERDIRPTDMDGMNGITFGGSMDFGYGKSGFVFYEVKYGNKDMDTGQRRHLESLVNYLSTPSLVLHVSHFIHDVNEDVLLRECLVQKHFCNRDNPKEWTERYKGKTALEVTKLFVSKFCPEYLIK